MGSSTIGINRKWPEDIKEEARQLRRKHYSYTDIVKRLNVPKSTLHEWIKNIERPWQFLPQNQEENLARMRVLAASALKRRRLERLSKITLRVDRVVNKYAAKSVGFSESMLAMLYWAEGSKGRGSLRFANTDPSLVLLFLTLLRECYSIDESKLRVRLHLHYYHLIRKTRKYWSSLLRIPESQFGKIYIKKRSKTRKFRKNFAGICFLVYYSEDLRFELLEIGRLLAKRLAPVAQLD